MNRKEILEKLNEINAQYEQDHDKLVTAREKETTRLNKELERIEATFKTWLKKQFGRMRADIYCNGRGLEILVASRGVFSFHYSAFEFNGISQELAEEIRNKYIDIYGMPKKNEIPPTAGFDSAGIRDISRAILTPTRHIWHN